ncbi:hypothetical protein PG995_014935 [Apiospora arundinis]
MQYQYTFDAEYQIYQFASVLEIMNPTVARRRMTELDSNGFLARSMPFNGKHVAAMRAVLQSISSGKNMDFREAAGSVILDRPLPDDAFDIFLGVMRAAPPITDDELRETCYAYITTKAKLKKVCETYCSSFKPKATISEGIDILIKAVTYANTEWRNIIRRECLYYELCEEDEGVYHPADLFLRASRCSPTANKQMVSYLRHGNPSPLLKQTVLHLDNENYNSCCPYTANTLVNLIQSLSPKERCKVVFAIDRANARLHQIPRAIARNFYHAVTWEPPVVGDKKMRDAAKAKVAIKNYITKWHLKRSSAAGEHMDALVKDLTNVCSKWDPSNYLRIPPSIFNAHMIVAIDLNNAMMDYLSEKGCEPEGDFTVFGTL